MVSRDKMVVKELTLIGPALWHRKCRYQLYIHKRPGGVVAGGDEERGLRMRRRTIKILVKIGNIRA